MYYDTSFYILGIELFPHTAYKYNGKFQALTLVDRHNPHRIRLFIGYIGFSIVNIVLFQLFDVAYKVKEPFIARAFKCRRLFDQHFHICFTLRPARHGCDIKAVARIFDNLPEQIMYCSIRNHFPEIFQFFQKCLQKLSEISALLFGMCVLQDCLIIGKFRICIADVRQLLRVQPCKRGGQYSRQRQLLHEIIQNSQVIQQDAHLISFKISFAAAGIGGNPFLPQHCREDIGPSLDASGQDHHIFIPGRPVSSGCFVQNPAA